MKKTNVKPIVTDSKKAPMLRDTGKSVKLNTGLKGGADTDRKATPILF
jgi:hypothetical protein